jgi:thermolysin
LLTFSLFLCSLAVAAAQVRPPAATFLALTATMRLEAVRTTSNRVEQLVRGRQLRRTAEVADRVVGGVRHERYHQTHEGVPVWGATVTLQHRNGVPLSTFGGVYEGLQIDTTPSITSDRARAIVAARAGVPIGRFAPAPLYVVAESPAGPRLAYVVGATGKDLTRSQYFVDAHDGTVFAVRAVTRAAAAVGLGIGVKRDRKKVSASLLGGMFVAIDALRPTPIETYDLRGDMERAIAVLNGSEPLGAADLASDADNVWTDAAVVDAHVHAGWAYDYLFKRFGRRGVDDRGLPIVSLVHPVLRTDIERFIDTAPPSISGAPREVPHFFVNAAYQGNGFVVYGDGLPPGFVLASPNGDLEVDYLSGALDIVAHEIGHGVVESTSNLEFEGESGALNEAFCDILGASVEFFFQSSGRSPRSDYLIAEDVLAPVAARSFANPAQLGQPDHYSQRFQGTADNGGVHINSGIPNHVFYLAIEGGTHATSGVQVTGVGAARRADIEQVFFRAFTLMLPVRATFAMARAATLQSAQDLFGSGSAVATAVEQAWTAVGVQ